MKTVRPKPLDASVESLPLTPEEGFVLSRIDGRLSVKELVALTGLEENHVEEILTKLASHGAIQLEGMESLEEHAEPMPIEHDEAPAPETAEETATPDGDDAASAAAERDYRKLYEEKFRALPTDERVDAARTAEGVDLFALCLDADPRIVAAILENHTRGLDHVRMMAFHHRTGTGLEMISRRQDWLRDPLVERRLLRNPHTPETVLSRVLSAKQLLHTYKIMVDREIPEQTRTRVRGHFRKKWTTAPPEERADLILRTEGRPLLYMTGCTFDARTTQIICGKTIASILLIQNFAKFPATPPSLLAHCVKQAFVRRNPGIRRLLLQHPNMPGDLKR